MEEGYRNYALATMVIAGLLIPVNLFQYRKRGISSLLLAAALGAFILIQYTYYSETAASLRYPAIGLLIILLIAHFIAAARARTGEKR